MGRGKARFFVPQILEYARERRLWPLNLSFRAARNYRPKIKILDLGAAFREAWRWRVVGFEFRGCGGFGLEVDGAVARDHFGDGVLEFFDTFSGDGGDFVEGELAALGHGGEFF